MMRLDRYAAVTAVGVPILLVTLGMLARTELVIGDRVREAIEARARAMGADVEVHSVGPSGLFGVELDRVSARIPRGDFALEVDVEAIVVTPTLGSLFGDVEIEQVEVRRGVVAIVPWSERLERPPATAVRQPSRSVAVAIEELQIVALNDAYRSYPLQLARVQFEWARGKPVSKLTGYGQLPDGVPFAIGAEDGRYRLRPQRATAVDAWVAPPAAGVRWPVTMQVRDIALCLECANVVALDDVEIGLPGWRDDVRITAPVAEVHRSGHDLSLGAPEMAIVDAQTRDFSVRLTEASFSYALDTGHLRGVLELAAPDGGKLRSDWAWDAEDFVVQMNATDFPLGSVWYLAPIGDHLQPGRMVGRARVGWDMRRGTLGLEADLTLDRLGVRLPYTGEEFEVERGRFELDLYADARGRAVSVRRAAMELGDALPIVAHGHLVDAGDGVAFAGHVEVTEQDASGLPAALPARWTAAVDGTELRGTFGVAVDVAGHSAFSESLVLDGEVSGDVTVVRDGTADVRAIGRSGPPPMLDLPEWTPLRRIGKRASEVVLAAEDAKFRAHDGFDWPGLHRAMVYNLSVRRPVRGGSTISQQVAKNLFLDGERTIARKLQEAYLTWRLEQVVPKDRILEIYLNLAEWAPGIRGIGGAARHYFGVDPVDLGWVEIAMLGAILPNPHRFGAWIDAGRIATSRVEKIEHILANLRFVGLITPADYQRLWAAAQRGEVGRLRLEVCDDDGTTALPRCP